MRRFIAVLSILLAAGSFAGCGSGLSVTSIQLGRAINTDNTVAKHTTTFAPSDTIYVSIGTSGVGSASISVRWMYGGNVVGEPKKSVSYRDDAATEFHLQSAGGFPPGDYTVEVFLDGQSAGSRTFRVER